MKSNIIEPYFVLQWVLVTFADNLTEELLVRVEISFTRFSLLAHVEVLDQERILKTSCYLEVQYNFEKAVNAVGREG